MTAADVYELRARVTAALESVRDGNVVDAEAILEDLEHDIARAEKDTGDD